MQTHSETGQHDTPGAPLASVPLAAGIGAACGAVLVGVWSVFYGLGAAPYPPFDLADWIIANAPGDLATWAIENTGKLAQRGLLAAGVVLWIIAGAAIGLVIRYRPSPEVGGVAALAFLPIVLVVSQSTEGDISTPRWMWWTLFFGSTLFLAGSLTGHWLRRLQDEYRFAMNVDPNRSWVDQPGSFERREVLTHALGAAVVFGLGGGFAGWLLDRTIIGDVPTLAGRNLREVRAEIVARATEEPVNRTFPEAEPAPPVPEDFPAPAGVRPRITSNEEFYTVDISTRNPNLPADDWSLRIHGEVENEIVLTYRDLLSIQPVEHDGTLMCISYYYGSRLISTTRWTGVPMRDVLQRAGIRDTATDIVMRGAGGYSDSFPLAKGLEPWTLLAYGMNGEALPRDHGFPCRVYVPNLYGIKNVKWLQDIEVTGYDYRGYWQDRGWSETGRINIISMIDTPGDEATPGSNGVVPVGGIAFAGSRGIQTVRIRIDGGPWQETQLETYQPELVWQRWRYDWRPEQGQHELTVQAVDGQGNEQIVSEQPPHPNGMTGLHQITVDVS